MVESFKEVKTFLRIKSVMTVNKLSSMASHLKCRYYIEKKGIRTAMARTWFKKILQKLYFPSYRDADISDKCYNVRPLINHFNKNYY